MHWVRCNDDWDTARKVQCKRPAAGVEGVRERPRTRDNSPSRLGDFSKIYDWRWWTKSDRASKSIRFGAACCRRLTRRWIKRGSTPYPTQCLFHDKTEETDGNSPCSAREGWPRGRGRTSEISRAQQTRRTKATRPIQQTLATPSRRNYMFFRQHGYSTFWRRRFCPKRCGALFWIILMVRDCRAEFISRQMTNFRLCGRTIAFRLFGLAGAAQASELEGVLPDVWSRRACLFLFSLPFVVFSAAPPRRASYHSSNAPVNI